MKTVLITGCSEGGIGFALAEQFSKAGCRVYATARRTNAMAKLESQPNITCLALDVCDKESISKCREYIEKSTGGHLDVLVNNAGIGYTTIGIEMDVDMCKQVFDANVFAVMEMNKQFSKMLIQAKGTILSIGSIAGMMPNPFGTVYHTSKAALHMYLDCLRIELEPFDVKVVTAVTGGVRSNIAANATPRMTVISDDSIYQPLQQEQQARQTVSQTGASMPTNEYAAGLVRKVLVPNPPPRIWRGNFANAIWVLNSFMPYWVTAYIMSRRFGFQRLKAIVRASGNGT